MSQVLCAGCQEGDGRLACKSCLLVVYCGPECQKQHWSTHKADCKSPLGKETWKPGWEVDGRQPLFVSGPPQAFFGAKKFLWGNVPAIDILKLDANEGSAYTKDIKLLFAASGDLRNVVKSVVSMPEEHAGAITITVNDRDFDVVACNIIILLVAFAADTIEQATDCIIHIWYSAMISESHLDILRGPVRQLVEDVCSKIASKTEDSIQAKTFRFGAQSLRVVLTKEKWTTLLAYLAVPGGLDPERAQKIRRIVTLAHERKDHRDRATFKQPPGLRLPPNRFREDGILLPFGHSRTSFNQWNPTMYFSDDWPMKDSADPLDGWSYSEVLNTPYGPARNDIYGKLSKYLTTLLSDFYSRVHALTIDFQLFHLDAQNLGDFLKDDTFTRIEVSNISDNYCLGAAMTIYHLARFLQSPAENPHATLIMLFMNAVGEATTDVDDRRDAGPNFMTILKYMPFNGLPSSPYDSGVLMRHAAQTIIRDHDKYFNRYMEKMKFGDIHSTSISP